MIMTKNKPPQTPEEIAKALYAGNPTLVEWRVAACLPSRTPEFLAAVQKHYRRLQMLEGSRYRLVHQDGTPVCQSAENDREEFTIPLVDESLEGLLRWAMATLFERGDFCELLEAIQPNGDFEFDDNKYRIVIEEYKWVPIQDDDLDTIKRMIADTDN